MTMQRPRILLSEGSSLSARETITALGLAGHRVELVSAEPLCLGRFSRFVSRVHPAPASGADPDGYLAAVLETVKSRSIDVLLPVHEQAYLFAAARHAAAHRARHRACGFRSFEQVQSKASLADLLTRLGVPQPETALVRSAADFARASTNPVLRQGRVRHCECRRLARRRRAGAPCAVAQLEQQRAFAGGVLVQAAVTGALERTQAVFDHGRLVASHIYRQIAEGPGRRRRAQAQRRRPAGAAYRGRIGARLAMARRAVVRLHPRPATGVPRFIDANPRLVEPMNAWPSGVDLPGALLRVSLGESPPAQPDGRGGVLTRLGLMGLMDAARRRNRRRDVMTELLRLATSSGRYRGTQRRTGAALDRSLLRHSAGRRGRDAVARSKSAAQLFRPHHSRPTA